MTQKYSHKNNINKHNQKKKQVKVEKEWEECDIRCTRTTEADNITSDLDIRDEKRQCNRTKQY